MDEQALIDRAVAGDEAAFRELVRRHEGRIFALCERILQNRQDAEDACIETFIRAYEHLHRLRAKPSIGPWLRRIATNFCISFLRRRQARTEELLPEILPAPDCWNPDSEVEIRDDARLLRLCMERMSAQDRTALILRYVEDISIEEMAGLLRCSRPVLKVRLHRARQRLKKLYDQAVRQPLSLRGGAASPVHALRGEEGHRECTPWHSHSGAAQNPVPTRAHR